MAKNTESTTFKCLPVIQPLGTFYVGAIPHDQLLEITYNDVRSLQKDIDQYLGIQRQLNPSRVAELRQYVKSVDACFPTAIIIAVPSECAVYNASRSELTLSAYRPEDKKHGTPFNQIAKIIDGQHRLAGLEDYTGRPFEINVSVFVDMDIADQAYLFSTVNLAQTKVNRSLVFDLFDYAKTRSPQKSCHNIAVALDQLKDSPFHERIKRLGVATEGRFGEMITQATFVQSLLNYVSDDPLADRNLYKEKKKPQLVDATESKRLIFRNMFIKEKDSDITKVMFNYFSAVRSKWAGAWNYGGSGRMLNRTNGFRALMRFLRPAYLHLASPGEIPAVEEFSKIFKKMRVKDDEFSIDTYKPGTSGEVALLQDLVKWSQIDIEE